MLSDNVTAFNVFMSATTKSFLVTAPITEGYSPSLILLFLIQLRAARRFETPRGIDLWDRYKKGIGEERWTYGIPVSKQRKGEF